MATFKLSVKRGQSTKDIVRSAGTAISGSDAIEVNFDQTAMTKNEAVQGLEAIKQRLLAGSWPQ